MRRRYAIVDRRKAEGLSLTWKIRYWETKSETRPPVDCVEIDS